MNSCRMFILAIAGMSGIAFHSFAADSLNLEEALARTMASNPVLAAEKSVLDASRARAERDALPAPYVIGGELENFAGSGVLSGTDSAESTFRIGRVIEVGGKRAARQSVGDASISRQKNLSEIVRLETISRTRTRYVAVLAGQQRLTLAREQVKQAERTRREVSSWVNAARNPESDLRLAEIALADAELMLESAEHELASARTTLAASWGAMQPDFGSAEGDLLQLPAVDPFEELSARLPQTASIRAGQFDADLTEAKRRLFEANRKPDVNLSLGVRRLESLDANGLVMSVSVPLGSNQRSRLEVEEAEAQREAIESHGQSQKIESHQELFAIYQELIHSRTEFTSLQKNMIPKAEQALAFVRRGFEAGRFSFVSLTAAQNTLFGLRVRSLEAAARYHISFAEIERLTTLPTDPAP